MVRRFRLLFAIVAAAALLLAACGGDDEGSSSDTTAASEATTATSDDDATDDTLPPFEPEPAEFEEAEDAQARFVNVFADDGEGQEIDVYWGRDAETGKKAATVAYGEATEWMPIEVETNPFVEPSDGSQSIEVAFYLAGETDRESLIMTKSETLDGEMALTYALGTLVPYDDTTLPGSLSVGYEHEAADAADGTGWVALNPIGVGGIEGGDFMTLNGPDGCADLTPATVEGGTANAGNPYELAPGATSITASDANTDCSFKTPPVELDVAAGDRWVLFAYGTTLEDRQLLALPLDAGEG